MVKIMKQKLCRLSTVILSTFLFAQTTLASMYNMPVGVTSISREIYHLHMTILYVCCAIGTVVFSILIWSLIRHRKSRGHKPAHFHSSLLVEIIWTVIPFIILIVMAIPATQVLIRMNDDSDSDINIKITGYQWKWKYDYLDEGISYFSNMSTTQDEIQGRVAKNENYVRDVDKPLVLPINKKVRILVTANDVIHSWWVPELGIKRDGIPGFIYESWFRIDKPGTYRGQCAELCGIGHAYMPIVVIAKTEQEYAAWVLQQRGEAVNNKNKSEDNKEMSKSDLMTKGQTIYGEKCSVCHKPDGVGMPPAFPSLVGSKVATGPVNKHVDLLVHGVKGTAMQAFGEQLSDAEIAAVVTFVRNSWGNDNQAKYGKAAGGLAQPKDVAAAR